MNLRIAIMTAAAVGGLVAATARPAVAEAMPDGTNSVSTNLAPAVPPQTPREFYNAGTRLLTDRKYEEAEKMFQTALASQDAGLQPAAMYNVGWTRFASGAERLKKGPDAQKAMDQGSAALAAGDRAIQQSTSALADKELNRMIDAYIDGRGVRRNLRDAEKAVSAALDAYGKTLNQWLRAADDFRGAAELNPADTNATHNAETVQRNIAKLVDSVRKMQDMMGMMGQKRQQLGKLLTQLKGQIPAPKAPPGMAGEDDEDESGVTPESLAGKKEGPGKEEKPLAAQLSPDQANQMLNGLSLDATRRLEMSEKQGRPPKDRKGRDW